MIILLLLLTIQLATATTLQGTIYNSNLEIESDVLIEIDTTPLQKVLTKEGTYSFELEQGSYTLTARKGLTTVNEEIEIKNEGIYTFDIFLVPDFTDEEDLWQDSEEELFSENEIEGKEDNNYAWWRYGITGIVMLLLFYRLFLARKKYGKLKVFRKRVKEDSKKSVKEHMRELEKEPGYIDDALEIIKKHDGRITQKQLRKEMLYLSEAKVSLIVTELEHKGKVEKVKKGRGNVIILKK